MRPKINDVNYLEIDGISVGLTHEPLDISTMVAGVRSPKAGATVLFAGQFFQQ